MSAQDNLVEYSAKVRSENDREPLVFVSITLKGTNLSTISNAEGEFILKVPEENKDGSIVLSLIGFEQKEVPLSNLNRSKAVVYLTPKITELTEVSITTFKNPEALVRKAKAMGADDAQVDYVASERFELDADTQEIKLSRTTHGEDTTLTVFQQGRKGSATLSGRAEEEIDDAVRMAVDAARAGIADEANQVAGGASLAASRHGPSQPDRRAMVDAAHAVREAIYGR